MTDLVALTCRLATGLESAGFDYAIGGAIALGYHAPPRATQDIDLNLFVEMDAARDGLRALSDIGVEIDIDTAERQCRERGDTRGWMDGVRVDVFVNSIPLHRDARRRRERVTLAGTELWILSAEDLVILKLLYHRPKDLDDCARVLALQQQSFDVGYVRDQLASHLDPADPRIAEFDDVVARYVES